MISLHGRRVLPRLATWALGLSRWLGWRYRFGFDARVSRQHREDPGRRRNTLSAATFPRGRSSIRRFQRERQSAKASCKAFSSNGHDKRIELVAQHLPQVADVGSLSRLANFHSAFAGRSSASSPFWSPSALPREGKTHRRRKSCCLRSRSLAIAPCWSMPIFAKPGIGRLLNLGSGKYAGFEFLSGRCFQVSIWYPSRTTPQSPNLVAIPTGPLPPNPADLLSFPTSSSRPLAELRTKFKFIVIDSPPIIGRQRMP